MRYDLIVIGAGPAGATAAIYGKRSGLDTLLLEKSIVGGNIVNALRLENYTGILSISGMDFGQRIKEQLESFDIPKKDEEVVSMQLKGEGKKIITNEGEYEARAVVIATGSKYRKLGVPGEEEFTGKGVSYCATCDAPFFKDSKVAVVGGGNSAVDDALCLSDVASEVYLIHRRDELRAEEIRQREMEKKGVNFIWNTVVEEINGEAMVESVSLKNVETGQRSQMDVDGIFIAIGYDPKTKVAKEAGVQLDDYGYIQIDEKQATNLSGVYAAGDCTGGLKQVSTAVGEGSVAAVSAYEYVKDPYWSD